MEFRHGFGRIMGRDTNFMHAERPRVITSFLIPTILLILMWAVKSFEAISGISLAEYGTFPKTAAGLVGIITSPFIHGDWSHLGANSVSLFVLTAALFYFYREIALQVLLLIWLTSGLWVWIGAREAYHIGASGIVYGMATFLFVSGLVRRNPRLSALSMFVVFVYGSLVWGVFPQFFPEKNISWESHLAGMIAGLALAIYYRKSGPREPRYSWEFEEQEQVSDTEHPGAGGELGAQSRTDPERSEGTKQEKYSTSHQGINVQYHYKPGNQRE